MIEKKEEEKVKVKRKYVFKNKQPTLKGIDIYESFVSSLLESNDNYFAIKAGYWDISRTVFSIQPEDLKTLKEKKKKLFNDLMTGGWKKDKTRKTLIHKLDEYNSQINDYKEGKKIYYQVINFQGWRDIMETLNFNIQDKIISGEKYKVTGIGYLEMIRIERNAKSFLNPKNVRYTEDTYCLVSLRKVCNFRNKKVYYAKPTMGHEGVSFKLRLFAALAKHPELKAKYKLYNKADYTKINDFIKEKNIRVRNKMLALKNGSI